MSSFFDKASQEGKLFLFDPVVDFRLEAKPLKTKKVENSLQG